MPNAKIHTMLFPGGKHKALTLSYDDGVLQDCRLIKQMAAYGIKGTFNLNSALLGRAEQMEVRGKTVDISTVRAEDVCTQYHGFEVATHGSKHSALTSRGSAALAEIIADRAALEKLTGYLVQGHAYPFGLYDKSVRRMLRAAGIRYARTVVSTHAFDLPKDFLKWHPTCHHADPDLMQLAEQFCTQNPLWGKPQLFFLWGHAYEFDADQNWEAIDAFFSYVSAYSDQIWMATNGQIADYAEAFHSLRYFANGSSVYNPSAHTVYLESCGTVYQIPSNATVELD